jgi:hypothetical protein
MLDSGFDRKEALYEKNSEFFTPPSEYGYGFWLRFLSTFPSRLMNGKVAPWYFVSRLTSNIEYDDVKMGDRLLAIWQGQGYYHFTTCNTATSSPNIVSNINFGNIEGVWTYIYYSYSHKLSQSVGLITYN